ncbi:fatty acid-binding protein, liver-like isoform X2 [Neoarius graeffei]|nr:fatty acid-binding protein, liver-like isoform X2 [Neoarius graeffei]XP_060776513.1 fatty acid-binding protein, liver-like isoform X2 [Neoarius graeffei]
MEQFMGAWKLTASKNFDDYMKAVGISTASRKIANLAKPILLFSIDDQGLISMKTTTTFKTAEIKFRLDEEFDEHTADDRQAKTVVRLVDGKLIQTQTWNGKSTTLEREVQDEKLILKCIMDDVVCIRTYERDE